jgi:hypothetical protein
MSDVEEASGTADGQRMMFPGEPIKKCMTVLMLLFLLDVLTACLNPVASKIVAFSSDQDMEAAAVAELGVLRTRDGLVVVGTPLALTNSYVTSSDKRKQIAKGSRGNPTSAQSPSSSHLSGQMGDPLPLHAAAARAPLPDRAVGRGQPEPPTTLCRPSPGCPHALRPT